MPDPKGRFQRKTFHSFIHDSVNHYLPITYYVPDVTEESDPSPALIVVCMVAGEAPCAAGGLRDRSLKNEMERTWQQGL